MSLMAREPAGRAMGINRVLTTETRLSHFPQTVSPLEKQRTWSASMRRLRLRAVVSGDSFSSTALSHAGAGDHSGRPLHPLTAPPGGAVSTPMHSSSPRLHSASSAPRSLCL